MRRCGPILRATSVLFSETDEPSVSAARSLSNFQRRPQDDRGLPDERFGPRSRDGSETDTNGLRPFAYKVYLNFTARNYDDRTKTAPAESFS